MDVLVPKWMDWIHDPVEPAVLHVYTVSSWEGEPVSAGQQVFLSLAVGESLPAEQQETAQ